MNILTSESQKETSVTKQAYIVLDETIYKVGKEYTVSNHIVLFPLFISEPYNDSTKYAIVEILGNFERIMTDFFVAEKIKILKYVDIDELHDSIADGEFKCFNGDIYRCLGKQLHSIDDMPSIQLTNSHSEWHKNGKRHRNNSLPAIECKNGKKYWYLDDMIYGENSSDDQRNKIVADKEIERVLWQKKFDMCDDQTWLNYL
jgi:hypothetical protein